jgi:predicted transcriptional regulator
MFGTGDMNDALLFYDYVSQYIKTVKNFNVQGHYTYKSLDVNRDIFLELDSDRINIGYKGIIKTEEELSNILNHRQLNGFFSKIIVDTTQDKIYKYYLLKHDVTDIIKNTIESVYIENTLSILEHGYMNCNKPGN